MDGSNTNRDHERAAPPGQETQFHGYSPLVANFSQVPMAVLDDHELDAIAFPTLLTVSALIAYEQFRRGVGRKDPVPIPWRVLAEKLRLTEDGARDRLATLEAKGRVRILEGPPQWVQGRPLAGPNLFVLRWIDEPATTRLASRVTRRLANMARKAESRSKGGEPLSRLRGSGTPTPEPPQGFEDQARLRGSNASQTPESSLTPISESTEITKLLDSSQPSVRLYPEEEGRTEEFPQPLLDVLHGVLDPMQIPHVQQGPFNPQEVWAILEALRVFGRKLKFLKAVTYNSLTNRARGEEHLGRTAELLSTCGWRELPEDGTGQELPGRKEGAERLAKAGLRRMPLEQAGLERRREIRQAEAAEATAKRRKARENQEGPAWALWDRLMLALRERIPERSFVDWIEPCEAVHYDGTTLLLRCGSPSARVWLEQQLADEFQEAMDGIGLKVRLAFMK